MPDIAQRWLVTRPGTPPMVGAVSSHPARIVANRFAALDTEVDRSDIPAYPNAYDL